MISKTIAVTLQKYTYFMLYTFRNNKLSFTPLTLTNKTTAINNDGVMVEEVTAVAKEQKIFNTLLKVKQGQFFAISGLRRPNVRRASESDEHIHTRETPF